MAIPCLGMQIYRQHSSCIFVQILREILLCLQDLKVFQPYLNDANFQFFTSNRIWKSVHRAEGVVY